MPWRRPADYYAEMVKSDAHMARVKAQLMHEQAQIEAADERRAPAAADPVLYHVMVCLRGIPRPADVPPLRASAGVQGSHKYNMRPP